MTREEVKELLPILQAFADGKTIQSRADRIIDNKIVEGWADEGNSIILSYFEDDRTFRIKPTPTYRPFKDAEECWNEMQKHQPFGWVMCKGQRCLIVRMTGKQGVFCENGNENLTLTGYLNDGYTFADGQPFGVKEE